MDCSERDRLESALAELVDEREYLSKISPSDPSFGLLPKEIESLGVKIQEVERVLQAHEDAHGCMQPKGE